MVQTSRLGQFVLSKDSVDVNVISLCSPVHTAERHYITEKSQLWSIVLVCHVSHETEKRRWWWGVEVVSILERGL